MWFGILGPLLVDDGGAPVDVPKGQLRVLLAALLVNAGYVVSADALVEVLWDGSPPPGATTTLRSHVLRLRRVLGPRGKSRLVTRHPGYLLQAGEDEVDLLRFRRLCREGSAALRASAWDRAQGLLGEALALWRGEPLTGIPSQMLRRDHGPGLEALRLQAEEWRIEAVLRLGGHAELVPELQSLAARHPLREPFHGQLMVALYRCGLQAEALAAYQRARDVLVAELGVEPGPGLRELHQRMLSADPALVVTELAIHGPAESGPPRELPPTVRGFTGRQAELEALTRLLDRSGGQAPETVAIVAISGTAGVGKTALAIHWAHQVTGRFPDGQLYVNLRGHGPGQPILAADALAGLLRSLGVSGQDIPPEADQRSARYRSLLAGKRMLVVLDNAGSADQARPLLPGTSACAVVVTSRDALAGLVARDGATRLDLGVLSPEGAVALLRALIGARMDAEPDAAVELAGQCCRLPLALRIAAELAASRPAESLGGLAGELADLRTRLGLLAAGGDPDTDVRTVFSWSYRHLDADTARSFRLLGLHPGLSFDAYATAALTGTSLSVARRKIGQLVRACLAQPSGAGCYQMHDLLRAYAADLAGHHDSEAASRAALTGLFDHYLTSAAAADRFLFPADPDRPQIPGSASLGRQFTSHRTALAWLDAHRSTIVAITAHAAAHGWPDHAIALAAVVFRYPEFGCADDAAAAHRLALSVATQTGDRSAEAAALITLAAADTVGGRLRQATGHLERACLLCQQDGDRAGEARALAGLGATWYCRGNYQRAAECHASAQALCQEAGDQSGQASARHGLGQIDLRQGRHQQAAEHLCSSLALFRRAGIRSGEAHVLGSLGELALQQGHFGQASEHLRQSLTLNRQIGSRLIEGHGLALLGIAELRLGHHDQAVAHLSRSLALQETGNPSGQAEALNGLGQALLAAGQVRQARIRHAKALALAIEADDTYEQARAHRGLACACQMTGDSRQARIHGKQSRLCYDKLGIPQELASDRQSWPDHCGGHFSGTSTPTV